MKINKNRKSKFKKEKNNMGKQKQKKGHHGSKPTKMEDKPKSNILKKTCAQCGIRGESILKRCKCDKVLNFI